MAAVYGSTSVATGILKKQYAPNLQYINPEEIFPIWKKIKQDAPPVTGKGECWVVGVRGPFGGAVGPYTELAALPTAFRGNSVKGEVTPKGLAAAFSITGVLMARAETDKDAFINDLDLEMNECETKFMRMQAFAAVSDGTLCVGCITGDPTNVANSVITLDTTVTDAPTLALYPNIGDEIEAFSDKAGGSAIYRTMVARVVAVASDFSTITVDQNISAAGSASGHWASGDYMFLKGARSTTSTAVFNVPDGFENIVADSGYATGLSPSVASSDGPTPTWWKSKKIDLGGSTAPSRALIHRMVRQISFRNNAKKPNVFGFNPVHAEDLVELYWGLYRETRGEKVRPGHGDFDSWQIPGAKGMEMLEDDYFLPGGFKFLNTKKFQINWLRKPEFLDKGDPPMIRIQDSNGQYDIWVGHFVAWYNMFTPDRTAHGYVTNKVAYSANIW